MKIINLNRGTILATNTLLCQAIFSRIKGLIGKKNLAKGEALIIEPCNSIHMFFMRFAIDAVFVHRNNKVVGLVKNLKPFRLSPVFFKARFVIELRSGAIEESHTQIGDYISLEG